MCLLFRTNYIVLEPNAIEVGSAFGRGRMTKDDIRAKRFIRSRGDVLYLYPKPPRTRRLRVIRDCEWDDAFFAWLEGIPTVPEGNSPRWLTMRDLRSE